MFKVNHENANKCESSDIARILRSLFQMPSSSGTLVLNLKKRFTYPADMHI